jgi:flagellar protein FliS
MSYFDQYLESRVLSASPLELVRLIYRGALDATHSARQHFSTGDIAERTRALNRAAGLVSELVNSLEPTADPALDQNLRRLYDYVLHQYAQAAIEQSPIHLDSADAILRSLLEAWESIDLAPAESLDCESRAISVSA